LAEQIEFTQTTQTVEQHMEINMKKLLIAAVICAFPYAATADMTGKRLKAHCERYPQQSELTALCTGFVWGSVETARALKVACEPAGVSGARLIDMTIKYLLAHPQELERSASSLIIDMYKKEFPCQPSRG
jgi:Rap1a immunity proteins